MREIIVVAVIVAICLVRGYGGGEEEKPVPPKNIEQEKPVPQNKVQELFLKLTPKTTREEFEAYVAAANLVLNKDNYDYKAAFTESDARFKRGTERGDYVQVSFNKGWTLNIAKYFNQKTWCSAFIISGNTPDDKATYSFEDIKNNVKESCAGALQALVKTVHRPEKYL